MSSAVVTTSARARKKGAPHWGFALLYLLPLLLALAGEFGAALASFVFGSVVWAVASSSGTPASSAVELDESSLRVNGDIWATPAEIEDANVFRLSNDSGETIDFLVDVRTWSGRRKLHFHLGSEAEAFAAHVRAARVGSVRARFVPRGARALRWGALAALLGAAFSLGSATAAIGLVAGAVAMFTLASTAIAARVTSSWVLLHRFGAPRRIAREDIARASIARAPGARTTLTLHLRGGRKVVLRNDPDWDTEREGMDALVQELSTSGVLVGTKIAPHLAFLRRRGRPADAWLEELRALWPRDTTYRAPAMPEAELWELVGDPAAPDDARLAAAVVLGRAPEGRLRIGTLSETAEESTVGAALRALAEEDADVERVLARVADE
ncbi:MAG TPA: hypothetical protein VGI39_43935 [Polyangiaceae bacterium]|jgi:hypothetical protein